MNWILYGIIYMGFLLGHTIILKNIDGIWIEPDSRLYYEFSRVSLTDSQFWGGVRSPVVLLFYKLFGRYDCESCTWNGIYVDDASLLYGQTIFSLAAFSFLAFACAKTARTGKGRLSLFVLPLLFSLVPAVARWNFMALSESFTISLFIVFVSVWIMFLSTRRSSWLVGVAIAALLWGGTRDTNAYVLIMIASIIMITMIVSIKFPKVPLMALGVWFICIFSLSNFSAETGDRWVFPFYNIMGQRILPVPEHVSYFSSHGMPINHALLMRSGKWASDDGWAFYDEPHLEKFRDWTASNGKMTYVKFLVSHIIYSTTAPAFDVAKDFLGIACIPHVDPSMEDIYGHCSSHSTIALFCFLIGNSLTICLAFVLWQRRLLYRFPYLIAPLIMILLSAPHAWLTWHGDAMETARHGLTAFIQLPLGFMLLWLYVWDHGVCASKPTSDEEEERRQQGQETPLDGP